MFEKINTRKLASIYARKKYHKTILATAIAGMTAFASLAHADTPAYWGGAFGDTKISAMAGSSLLTLKTCGYDAGAICSLMWKGKEFINDSDHGRQLQSALSFDGKGEAYNPTEAGADFEGNSRTDVQVSSSVLLNIAAKGNVLETTTRMAFWHHPLYNNAFDWMSHKKVSNHLLSKRVTLGAFGLSNVIQYENTFVLASNEAHTLGQFEVLTAYMPKTDFSQFWSLDVKAGETTLRALTDGNAEQNKPIVFSSADGNYAMGIYSPDLPQDVKAHPDYQAAGYGRWRYASGDSVKWNNVFRYDNPVGNYSFISYVIVGSREEVRSTMLQLASLAKPMNEYGIFNAVKSNYAISKTASGYAVSSNSDGKIFNFDANQTARIKFTDATLAFDLNGTAGKIYRLINGAFNRVPDAGGTGFWIKQSEDGATLEAIAAQLISSTEFKKYGSNLDDTQFIKLLYSNVLRRTGSTGDINFWVDTLKKRQSREKLLTTFTESPENIARVAPEIANGISYKAYFPSFSGFSAVSPAQKLVSTPVPNILVSPFSSTTH
ncbi:DUF4214 domain-containing protein [Undibacterium sp. Di27W]|uniref:DUF4214 domain-containing protein n=1 Tax=Undibacterium sp. Di27W TaxID=3413036 RepID=UPI003BF3F225